MTVTEIGLAIYNAKPSVDKVLTCADCGGRCTRHRAADGCTAPGELLCDRCTRRLNYQAYVELQRVRQFYEVVQALLENVFPLVGGQVPAHWLELPRAARRRASQHEGEVITRRVDPE